MWSPAHVHRYTRYLFPQHFPFWSAYDLSVKLDPKLVFADIMFCSSMREYNNSCWEPLRTFGSSLKKLLSKNWYIGTYWIYDDGKKNKGTKRTEFLHMNLLCKKKKKIQLDPTKLFTLIFIFKKSSLQ